MEMNQVRYFLAVCEHRNFTHAARASFVSQPSLTAAIQKLEDELGGALFLRDRAGCRLTPLGMRVRPHIEAMQQQSLDVKLQAARYHRLERVPVSVGLGETIGQRRIASSIERYRRSFPNADIELIVDSQPALLERLRVGSLDISVTSGEANDELYRVSALYSEGYQVVVAKDHPLSSLPAISLAHLSKTPLLDRLNCEMRESLFETCSAAGYEIYAAYRSNRIEWLLAMARKGSGVAILPETAIPDEPGLVSLPLEGLQIERHISALRFRHQPSRPEVETLVRELVRPTGMTTRAQ